MALARIGLLPRSVWRHVPPAGVHELSPSPGIRFLYRAAEDDVLARSIVWTNLRDWEYSTVSAFIPLARMSGGFVDVGAYTGVYSLIAAAANPGMDILAIEPNPTAFRLLRENLRLNRVRCDARLAALGAEPGRGHLVVPADSTTAHVVYDERHGGLHVQVLTLDEITDGMKTVDLVKIDVEGSEEDVLRGSQRTLRTHHPRMIVEALTAPNADRVVATLRGFGYRAFLSLLPTGPVRLDDLPRRDPASPNLLCATDEPNELLSKLG